MTWRQRLLKLEVGNMVRCIVNENRKLGPKGDYDGYGGGWVKGKVFRIHKIYGDIAFPEDASGVFLDCLEVIN